MFGVFGTGNVGVQVAKKRKRLRLHGRTVGLEMDPPTRRPPLQTRTGTRAEDAREIIRGAKYTFFFPCRLSPTATASFRGNVMRRCDFFLFFPFEFLPFSFLFRQGAGKKPVKDFFLSPSPRVWLCAESWWTVRNGELTRFGVANCHLPGLGYCFRLNHAPGTGFRVEFEPQQPLFSRFS